MLATGIKNGILLILIILIVHFLLKNYLLEKRGGMVNGDRLETLANPPEDILGLDPVDNTSKAALLEKTKNTDLYKYVMEDGEMEKFFDPQLLPESNDKFDTAYPIACDAKPFVKDDTIDRKVKKPKNADQKNNGFLVVHDYMDENALNGGKLFDGLQGYDEYDSFYQEYKC